MAASQQAVATNQPQPAVITTAPAPVGGEINKVYQAKLRGLAIVELVLGPLCLIIGAVISGIVGSGPYTYYYSYNSYESSYQNYPSYRYVRGFTTGEGIWCGIWILVAGALGVRAAKPFASRCMITTHMAFSIVASVFSGVMFIISVIGAISGNRVFRLAHEVDLLVLFGILSVLSFVSMILLIISASYCCTALKCCGSDASGQGCDCCMPYGQPNMYAGGNVVYTQQATVGGQAVVYPQQQAGIDGQQMVYAQQPGMAGQPVTYVQQPAVAGQPVVYAQQPMMAYQNAPNVPQGYVIQSTQPMAQPGFQGTVIQPIQGVANQGVQNPAASEKTQQGFGAIYENNPPSYQSPQ